MIEWSEPQRRQVEAALHQHPATSNDCAQAAQLILQPAAEVDSEARAEVVEPTIGIYVQPKGHASARWLHHVTVGVTAHYVDALTGPDGHEQATYLETFFDHPREHITRPVEPEEWEEL